MITQKSRLSSVLQRRLAWIGLLISPVILTPSPAAAGLLFKGTFEGGLEPEWESELCCSHSAGTVSSPTRGGNRAVKFNYRRTDATQEGARRSELRLDPVPQGSERWYAFSLYFPTNFQTTNGGFITTQWHHKLDEGESGHAPPLYLATNGQKLTLVNSFDTDRITPNREYQTDDWDLGALPKGRWVDFVFHVRWSANSDGLLEVWKDGQKLLSKPGPVTFNDQVGPYMKIGMYASGIDDEPGAYNFDQQTMYFDRIRIGDSNSSYAEVAAGGEDSGNPGGGGNPQPNGKVIRIEAERMNLSTYRVEATDGSASGKKVISLLGASKPEGTATVNFPGPSGRYNVVVGYFDEEDGRGRMSLKQDGQQLDWWTFDQKLGSGSMDPKTFVRKTVKAGVGIRKGDSFKITGVRDQSEYTRIDYLEFVPVGRYSATIDLSAAQ